jgi:orotidine-5'-phosphate decarboxylase
MTNPLLVALDVESGPRALQIADDLRGIAGGFKIGNRLFTLEGPRIVSELVRCGDRVFLDLKFHDIPNTVAAAVDAATQLGVWMVNVHASGGVRMMQAARDAARDASARASRPTPLVIAVTVLTSMSDATLAETGVGAPMLEHVARLARLTQEAADGVVASPRETALIRKACGADFDCDARHPWGGAATGGNDDQERTMSPRGRSMRAPASSSPDGRSWPRRIRGRGRAHCGGITVVGC